jgi:N-acetylneuraminic acid mutarotase
MIIWGGDLNDNTGGKYDLQSDVWTATSTTNTPSPRSGHTAVWTGSKMIIWGGISGDQYVNTGGVYDPASDSWTATSTTNAPTAYADFRAVWTGSEMIVWGGPFYGGAKYNPDTDTWSPMTPNNDLHAPMAGFTAVWTGSEAIFWGGFENTGSRYDPATDSWTAASTASAPSARYGHTAVWAGSEMIIWGGSDWMDYTSTGGRYTP